MKPNVTTFVATAILIAGPLTAFADQNPRRETPETQQQRAQTRGGGLCVPGVPTVDMPPGNPCPPGATDLGGKTSKEKPGGSMEPGSPTMPNGTVPGSSERKPGTSGQTGRFGGNTPIR